MRDRDHTTVRSHDIPPRQDLKRLEIRSVRSRCGDCARVRRDVNACGESIARKINDRRSLVFFAMAQANAV